jgi:hypothetical protein
LTTILSCSERVKALSDARVLVRFYEIPQRDVADKISIYMNSQSAVKPRDLRSNDKRVLAIKKAYEAAYPTGYLITKRGEACEGSKSEVERSRSGIGMAERMNVEVRRVAEQHARHPERGRRCAEGGDRYATLEPLHQFLENEHRSRDWRVESRA